MAHATNTTAMEQFILFGDSITQASFSQSPPRPKDDHSSNTDSVSKSFGFGAALTDAYVRRLDVINRGLSGYNTAQALKVLPRVIPSTSASRVRFLTIFFGANDARLPDAPGPSQTVPLEQYKENLKAILTHPLIQDHRKEGMRVILITPAPIEERLEMESNRQSYPDITAPTRTATNAALYARACVSVGAELNLPVLNLWAAMMERASWKNEASGPLPGSMTIPKSPALRTFLYDGLHFSGPGYRVLFDELMTFIEKRWPEQMPENLSFVQPAWDDENAWRDGGKL